MRIVRNPKRDSDPLLVFFAVDGNDDRGMKAARRTQMAGGSRMVGARTVLERISGRRGVDCGRGLERPGMLRLSALVTPAAAWSRRWLNSGLPWRLPIFFLLVASLAARK